jgi:hypothetical protein
MPQGPRYYVGGTLNIYRDAGDARNRRNPRSTITDNSSSIEGAGTPYIDNYSGYEAHYPAIPIWWIPHWGGSGWSLGWVNDNDNYSATTPTFAPSSVDLGQNVTINLPRNHQDIHHTVEYDVGGAKGTIGTNLGTSVVWTPSITFAEKFPNATSGTSTITVKTYVGTRLIGSRSRQLTLRIPTSLLPTVSHTISEGIAGIQQKFGIYIQGQSKLNVVSTAAGIRGSTIKSIVTTVGGVTYAGADITTAVIGTSGAVPVKTTVTDSRGRTRSITTNISFTPYSAPTINDFSAFRSNAQGIAVDDGVYARVTQKFSITPLSNLNTRSWKIESREVGTTTWIQRASGSVYSYNGSLTTTGFLDSEKAYELRLTVSDYFSAASIILTVSSAFKYLSIWVGNKAVGVGVKPTTPNTFMVGLDTVFQKDVTAPDITLSGGSVEDRLAGVPKFVTLTSERTYGTGANYLRVRITIPEAYRNNLGIIPNWNTNSSLLPYLAYQTYSSTFDIQFYHANLGTIPSTTWAEAKITIIY